MTDEQIILKMWRILDDVKRKIESVDDVGLLEAVMLNYCIDAFALYRDGMASFDIVTVARSQYIPDAGWVPGTQKVIVPSLLRFRIKQLYNVFTWILRTF